MPYPLSNRSVSNLAFSASALGITSSTWTLNTHPACLSISEGGQTAAETHLVSNGNLTVLFYCCWSGSGQLVQVYVPVQLFSCRRSCVRTQLRPHCTEISPLLRRHGLPERSYRGRFRGNEPENRTDTGKTTRPWGRACAAKAGNGADTGGGLRSRQGSSTD